ncbi:unnamed protein product [Calicophoron daubneyi]|uniref:Uncharacterized protein n=1 Tax=Calicophoron daubneyi TaxID=300641 RepID=A0AAV2TCF8_CALDB
MARKIRFNDAFTWSGLKRSSTTESFTYLQYRGQEKHKLFGKSRSTPDLPIQQDASPIWRNIAEDDNTAYRRANLPEHFGVGGTSGGIEWHKCQPWIKIQQNVINILLCKGDYDVTDAMQNIRILASTPLRGHILEYFETKILPNVIRSLRKPLQSLQDLELLNELGTTWKRFFSFSIPTTDLIFSPLHSSGNTLEYVLLKAFFHEIVQKLDFKKTIDRTHFWNPNLNHMCFVLSIFCREELKADTDYNYSEILIRHLGDTDECEAWKNQSVYEKDFGHFSSSRRHLEFARFW